MASNAMKAGALALGLSLVAGMGGCGNEPESGQTGQEQGGLSGELVVVSVMDAADRGSSLYFLRPADHSADVGLLFDTDPGLTPGTMLRVWGTAAGTDLRVSRYEVVPPIGSALINAPPQKAQTVAWVQIDINGGGRFGLAQLQGEPMDATVARGGGAAGTWAGPVAYAGIGAHFGHVLVALGIEGGRVLRTVSGTVDDGRPISIDGNWACGTVAAGWGE